MSSGPFPSGSYEINEGASGVNAYLTFSSSTAQRSAMPKEPVPYPSSSCSKIKPAGMDPVKELIKSFKTDCCPPVAENLLVSYIKNSLALESAML